MAARSWKKVLFLNDSTGAMDLTIDPTNPRILFASMWKFQRMPWGMNAGGGRSGLWKTTDGGDTWKEITFNPGIPAKPLGKIGVVDLARESAARLREHRGARLRRAASSAPTTAATRGSARATTRSGRCVPGTTPR